VSDRHPPATARERREAERRDRDLAPYDRGPVKAFIRDEVDARRRLVGAFLPVLGIVIIAAVNPASDWQRYALYAGLAALAAVVVDAVLMGVTITRAAREAFPGESVPGLATGWYAFLRAHRSRSRRRPPPRFAPRGRPVSPTR
jgi:ABC-type amino acid transport substrate-binding protein